MNLKGSHHPASRGVQGSAELSRWSSWSLTIAGTVLVTFGSIAVGYFLSVEKLEQKAAWVLGSAVLTVVGIVLVGLPQVFAARQEQRRSQQMTDFNDGLSAVHEGLSRLLQSDRRRPARNEFFRAMLQGAVGLFGLRGTRVCVYLLDSRDDDEAEEATGAYYLKLQDHAGRNDTPRRNFEPDTLYGAAIIEAALAQKQVTVSNRAEPPVPVDYHDGTVWQSFFVVPLTGKDHVSRGVLTVDTRHRTIFTEEDVTIGWTVARLIGVGVDEIYDAVQESEPMTSAMVAGLLQTLAASEDERGEGA